MSDTQFSSLSPNSSYDLDNGKQCSEDNDLYDQETLSITSNKSLAEFEDFDDERNTDPFLSDFMKEDTEEAPKLPLIVDNFIESNDGNVFFSSFTTETDSDDCLFMFTDVYDGFSNYLLDFETSASPANPLSMQRQLSNTISNKRAFSPIENIELTEMPLSSKHRRVDVSSHVRCDEWINKYHEKSDTCSFKASGMLDRRKTKHHKILSEADSELQMENPDAKGNRMPVFVHNKISMIENTPVKVISQKFQPSFYLSESSTKFPTIRSVSRVIRKSFIQCTTNNNPTKEPEPYITPRPSPDSPTTRIPHIRSSTNLSTTCGSRTIPDIVELSRIPAPLKMGKRVSRRGHRLSLWQFLLCLLDSSKYREHSTGIKWINRTNGVFHIIDSKQVATLWGQYKERRDKMTYDSLARSLRHYYKKNLMAKINNRRLVYQIAQECLQWSSDTFVRRIKEEAV